MDPLGFLWFVLGCALTWWLARKGSKELQASNALLQGDNAALRRDNADLRHLIDELRNENHEVKLLVEKLPADFRTAIASDPRTTLTIQQLQELSRTVTDLHQRQQARALTPEQRERLITVLRQLEPKPIRIVSAGDSDEADQFRDQLSATFEAAGWPVSSSTGVAAMNVNGLSLDYFGGHSGHLPSTTPPGDDTLRLKTALEQAGLNVRTRPLPDDEQDLHWILSVGQKPTMS